MSKAGRKLNPTLKALLLNLDDNEVYTAATIADQANLPDKQERYKIRNTLNRFTHYHDFSPMGDGQVALPGQGARSGWFGWRFKKAARLQNSDSDQAK